MTMTQFHIEFVVIVFYLILFFEEEFLQNTFTHTHTYCLNFYVGRIQKPF